MAELAGSYALGDVVGEHVVGANHQRLFTRLRRDEVGQVKRVGVPIINEQNHVVERSRAVGLVHRSLRRA